MTTPRTVTEVTLERYRLGELPEADAAVLEAAVASDPALQTRLLALDQSDEDLLRDHPVATFVSAVRAQAASTPASAWLSRPAWFLAPVTLVAAWLMVTATTVIVPPGDSGSSVSWHSIDGPPGDRLKGSGPALLLFMKRGDQVVEQLATGARTHAGEVVQLAYRGGTKAYGVILSIDGRGQVTRHLPVTGDAAAPLQHGGITALDVAYQLDAAPRAERFYFITADEPFPVGQALAAARTRGLDPLTLDRLPLDPSYVQASFLLRKE